MDKSKELAQKLREEFEKCRGMKHTPQDVKRFEAYDKWANDLLKKLCDDFASGLMEHKSIFPGEGIVSDGVLVLGHFTAHILNALQFAVDEKLGRRLIDDFTIALLPIMYENEEHKEDFSDIALLAHFDKSN